MIEDEKDRTFQMRVSETFLAQIDEWRRASPDLPSRAEAVRRLISAGFGRYGLQTFDGLEKKIEELRKQIEALENGRPKSIILGGKNISIKEAIAKEKENIATLERAQKILAEKAFEHFTPPTTSEED